MNAFTSTTAYGHGTAARSPRSVEYDAFVHVTRGLAAAADQRDTAFPAYAKALHDNKRLWRALASDLARPDNALPASLKAQILGLFQFVGQHTGKALRKDAGIEVLIDLNTAIMRGLRGEARA